MLDVQGSSLRRRARRPCPLLRAARIVVGLIIELSLLSAVEPLLSPPRFKLLSRPLGYHNHGSFRSRESLHALFVVRRKPLGEENKNDFCVAIGHGTALTVESLRFPHSLLVLGFVNANLLVCSGDADDPGTLVRIGKGGVLHANIDGVKTVEAFGKLIGNIECDRLVVGK